MGKLAEEYVVKFSMMQFAPETFKQMYGTRTWWLWIIGHLALGVLILGLAIKLILTIITVI